MPQKNKSTVVRVEHVWSVLCSNSSVDQMSGNISLFSVFEQLNLEKKQIEKQEKPGRKVLIPVNFQLVTLLRKIGGGEFMGNLKTEMLSPRGEVLGVGESEIKFQDSKDRFRVVAQFSGLPISGDGYYLFQVSMRRNGGEYEKIAEVPLQVVFN